MELLNHSTHTMKKIMFKTIFKSLISFETTVLMLISVFGWQCYVRLYYLSILHLILLKNKRLTVSHGKQIMAWQSYKKALLKCQTSGWSVCMPTRPIGKKKQEQEWVSIDLFPFVPSEPAGIQQQHFSLARLPSPNSGPLSPACSDVIVSCKVDADAQPSVHKSSR